MTVALALSPTFAKGILAVVSAFVLFVGSVYLILSAVFGRKMGLAVLSTAFFSWMIILSLIWMVGDPLKAAGTPTTPKFEGPRGTEAHWQVVGAGAGAVPTKFPATAAYPQGWRNPTTCPPPAGQTRPPGKCHNTIGSVQAVIPAIQAYLASQAQQQLAAQGHKNVLIDPTTFSVTNVQFATSNGTYMAVGRGFDSSGGPAVTVFVYHSHGDVPIYSIAFLVVSILGFALSVPFLDRLEATRKAVLTGGTAAPWYGPS